MRISQTGGLIAAASKKATQPLLELGGISVVKRIVLTFQQRGLFPIVVVTGVEADEVKYELAGRGVVFLHNESYEDPELFDSARMGLSFLQGSCERIAFSPVNVPLFLPSTLGALLNTEQAIVTPSYQGEGGHPVLISDTVIPDILSWQGEGGLRAALESLSPLRQCVPVDDEGVTLTIHQQEELHAHYEANKAALLHPYLRISLEREEELFNARAKLLLFLIGETRSTRAAARMMALSPSKAWDLLNQLESALGYALITRHQGGSQGSRSTLTSAGADFLRAWQKFEERVLNSANLEFEQLDSYLAPPAQER